MGLLPPVQQPAQQAARPLARRGRLREESLLLTPCQKLRGKPLHVLVALQDLGEILRQLQHGFGVVQKLLDLPLTPFKIEREPLSEVL